MGKKVDVTLVLDAALAGFESATEYYVVTAEPTSRATSIAAKINTALTLSSGDFMRANGDVSGRKSTLAAKDIPITSNGTAVGVATCTGSTLVAYTPFAAPIAFNALDTAQLSAWKLEINQPA